MKKKTRRSRVMLIALGVALGYAARFVLGPPAVEADNPNQFNTPLPEQREIVAPEEEINLELIGGEAEESGLVPPLQIPSVSGLNDVRFFDVSYSEEHSHIHSHDGQAEFEPHGEQVCASGCALSRHPTGGLSFAKYVKLTKQYEDGPLDSTNAALEELLFFGPQTRKWTVANGVKKMATEHSALLLKELRTTHAKVSLRVIDSEGVIRTWLEPTRVPFDRRHVFEMETENLQPLVTSGTVKRVGLDHLWVRL